MLETLKIKEFLEPIREIKSNNQKSKERLTFTIRNQVLTLVYEEKIPLMKVWATISVKRL